MDQRWLQWSTSSLLPALKAGESGGENLEFRLPCSSKKMFKTATDTFGTQRHDYAPNASQWQPASIGCAVSELCKKCKGGVSGKLFSSVTRYDKGSRLAADYHSLPRPLRDKLETLAQRAEMNVDKGDCEVHGSSQADNWKVYARRVRWTWLPCRKRRTISVCVAVVLDTKFGPWYDVTVPPCSFQNSTGRLCWKNVSQGCFHTSTTTHCVLSQRYFPPGLPSRTCFIVPSHAVDSGTPV